MDSKLKKAYDYMIKTCNCSTIGYSQDKRTTINPDKSTRTYCDCSSQISKALTVAGFYEKNPWFTTYNEQEYLRKAGFTRYDPDQVSWKAGDILHRRSNGSGHTEMVYQGHGKGCGITMGAHGSSYSFPNQVSINKSYSYARSWMNLWRWEGESSGDKKHYDGIWPTLPKRGYFKKGDKGVNVKRVQLFLIWAGYSVGTYGADGIYGSCTAGAVDAFEYDNDLTVDGEFGPLCLKKAKEITR